jgi:hypothetical protein
MSKKRRPAMFEVTFDTIARAIARRAEAQVGARFSPRQRASFVRQVVLTLRAVGVRAGALASEREVKRLRRLAVEYHSVPLSTKRDPLRDIE